MCMCMYDVCVCIMVEFCQGSSTNLLIIMMMKGGNSRSNLLKSNENEVMRTNCDKNPVSRKMMSHAASREGRYQCC